MKDKEKTECCNPGDGGIRTGFSAPILVGSSIGISSPLRETQLQQKIQIRGTNSPRLLGIQIGSLEEMQDFLSGFYWF